MKDSEAERAGLQAEDTLLSWACGDAKGNIEAPFDLQVIEVEQAPRGAVRIEGLRGTEKRVWVLRPGSWGLHVRPNLIEPLLAIYLEAQKLAAAGEYEDATSLLRSAADKSQQSQSSWLGSWFLLHACQILADAQQWQESDAACVAAIQKSVVAGPPVKAQLLRSWADKFQQRADWSNAELRYKEAAEEMARSGREDLMYADTLNALGSLAWRRRDLDQVKKLNSQALAIEQNQAPGSLIMAKSLSGLGLVALTQGDLVHAEEDFSQTLNIN